MMRRLTFGLTLCLALVLASVASAQIVIQPAPWVNANTGVAKGSITLPAGAYWTLGGTTGESGYGCRDASGNIECKDSGGTWQRLTLSISGWTRTGAVLSPTTAGDSLVVQDVTIGAGRNAVAYNTGLGRETLASGSLSGNYNTAVGRAAAQALTTGQGNTAVGALALAAATTGNYQTAVGMLAASASTASDTVAVGYNAVAAANSGIANTGVGYNALAKNTDGDSNTGVGWKALWSNLHGHANTAVGTGALVLYAGGADDGSNTAVGWQALTAATEGRYNTALGSAALWAATGAGWYNTGVGHSALYTLTTGATNTAIGDSALYANATGSGNVALGYSAGRYYTGSDRWYLDNRDRTNTAGDDAGALMWGTFHATPSSQTITINGALTLGAGTTPASSGQRFLCITTTGAVVSSATACSGT